MVHLGQYLHKNIYNYISMLYMYIINTYLKIYYETRKRLIIQILNIIEVKCIVKKKIKYILCIIDEKTKTY